MKSFFTTVFLMGSGVVLFLAAVVVAGALFFAHHAGDGRLGDLRIEVSREDGKGLPPGQAEARRELRSLHRSLASMDGDLQDLSKEFDRFFERFDRRMHEAGRHLRRSRARLSSLSERWAGDQGRKAALEEAARALDQREKMYRSLASFRKTVVRQAEDIERSSCLLRKPSLRAAEPTQDGAGAGKEASAAPPSGSPPSPGAAPAGPPDHRAPEPPDPREKSEQRRIEEHLLDLPVEDF